MVDYSIKLTPTRDERREMDRAAKAAGFKNTGPWALSKVLEAARAAQPAKATPASTVAVPGPDGYVAEVGKAVEAATERIGSKIARAAPLIPSYDPDHPAKD